MQRRFDTGLSEQELVNRFFPTDGDLACLCREKDWSTTPLGPVGSWPASLRTIAAMVVASPLPMIVLWGPELVQVYNDGYRGVMGKKHPHGLGQPNRACWAEVWEFNAPLFEGVTGRRETFSFKDQRLMVERHGYPEEAFFTLGYSPVFDDDGEVGGVLVTVSETTAEVEWKTAVARAAESDERLRIALEAAELGTWDLDLKSDTAPVRSLRHDQIFGYERQQAEWGQDIALRHVLPEDRPIFQEAFARAMETGVLSFEVRVRWPDGSIHWVAPLGRTYHDNDGRPVRMVGVVADVTRRNESAALRRSEERFRLMADAVPQMVWITDAEGKTEFFNRQWSDYTGLEYSPETASDVATMVLHPDDATMTMERFRQARTSGAVFLVEHRIRAASGDYRWFMVRAHPYHDPVSGTITRWFGASVDIHDRKLAADAMRALTSRQAFQLALTDRVRPLSSPHEVTAAACELLGRHLGAKRVVYGEVDDAGKSLVLRPDWTNGQLVSMSGMAVMLDDFGPLAADVVRAGNILSIEDVSTNAHSAPYAGAYMSTGIRAVLAIPLMKQGRLQALLNIHDSEVHPWTSEEIALAQDVVDRIWSAVRYVYEAQKREEAENALREKVAHLAFILEAAHIGDAVWDLATNANTRSLQHDRVFGYTEPVAEWNFDIFVEHVHPDDRHYVIREFEEAMAELKNWNIEFRSVRPDKSIHWIALHGSLYLENGQPKLMIGIVIDITERKRSEQTLKDADRRKDEFLAMLAHELRNPLAPIGAAAELLQLMKLDEGRVRQTSQIISRQVRHMTGLVDDLLDVSRVTRGLVELDNALLDIGQVVVEAIEQVTPLIRSRHHHLALEMAPETPLVKGDKKRLVQVVVNLLNNAAKYTREGGQIRLKTDVHSAHVLVQITDNGIGMTPELVARAFDLFAQAERSSDRSSGGLGLGLALVRSLVELHRGTVKCESAGLGMGSTFSVCLPRQHVEETPDPSQAPDSSLQETGAPLRILVVDDNADAAAMLGMLLEAAGHEVLIENGSHGALERAKSAAPQICLLDIGLPEIDGNELAQRLRAQPETAASILIAVTGYGQENDRVQALAAGFDYHLVKPVDTRELASILAGAKRTPG